MWFKVLSDPDGIPDAYPGEYGHDGIAETYLLSEAARSLFREALAGAKPISRSPKPRLLDVGAAQGVLLEEAVRMGFDAEGIDHCEPNVREACAKGLTVKHGAAEDLAAREDFDVITMIDIVEHVRDPMVCSRRRIGAQTRSELVVYTPNRAARSSCSPGCPCAGRPLSDPRIFGRNHCFFDDRSLPLALEGRLGALARHPYDPPGRGSTCRR
jgi:hypothetical protein